MRKISLWRVLPRLAAAVLACVAWGVHAEADKWPSRPVTIIVPFPPGGPSDTVVRAVAQKMSASLGQSFVIENRPGASGNIGTAAVAHATPDGYTLLGTGAPIVTASALYPKLNYAPLKDLAPLALLGSTPVFVWVNKTMPVADMKTLMATVKAKPGSYNFSSSAPATLAHLSALYLFDETGAQLVHLNYKGSMQGVTDFLGGVYPIDFEVMQPLAPHMANGAVRPLAVVGTKRSPLMPDVPSLGELGLPALDVSPFLVLMAPSGTPAAIQARASAAAREALKSPEVRARLKAIYFQPDEGTEPAAASAWLRAQTERWGAIIRKHKLTVE